MKPSKSMLTIFLSAVFVLIFTTQVFAQSDTRIAPAVTVFPPIFSIQQSQYILLAVSNENASSSANIKTGDFFRFTFDNASGNRFILKGKVYVNSKNLKSSDFSVVRNTKNQFTINYAGDVKPFAPGDSFGIKVSFRSPKEVGLGKITFQGTNDNVRYQEVLPSFTTLSFVDYPTGPKGDTGAKGGYITHTIGESYGGGIVFYVYDGGQHGLIAATADQSTGVRWWAGTYTYTMAYADGVGAGLKNTAIIIANQGYGDGGTYAARVCNEYAVTVGGVTYSDWYLPSKFELNLLYLQKDAVGGFASSVYWSSADYGYSIAWFQSFGDGGQFAIDKDYSFDVRAVRAF